MNKNFILSNYTFSDSRKIEKVYNTLKTLSKTDNFFKIILSDFESETNKTILKNMCNRFLELYQESIKNNMQLITILELSTF